MLKIQHSGKEDRVYRRIKAAILYSRNFCYYCCCCCYCYSSFITEQDRKYGKLSLSLVPKNGKHNSDQFVRLQGSFTHSTSSYVKLLSLSAFSLFLFLSFVSSHVKVRKEMHVFPYQVFIYRILLRESFNTAFFF